MRRLPALGSYAAADTPAHRLDARVKLGLLAAGTVASFVVRTPAGMLATALGLVVALLASRTRPRDVARALRPAALVLLLSLAANSLVLFGQPGISLPGLARGATAVLRIVLVVGWALVFSSTTTPPAIADALAALASPLERLGVRVADATTVVSVALRFVPLCAEEADRIRCAQAARGARLDSGGVVARLRAWSSVLVPMLVSLFRRADELARAMCDRGYTGVGRTMAHSRLARRDRVAALLGVAWLAACLALG